ncbi:MAG TPA: glutathione binding-like protein, partial [Kofleriaceae bacterium]|nr:glutathione binding-like protein [Kofleriaceae bacterium]
AEKAGKLIPKDFQGRTRVMQWCFAAVSTVAPTLTALDLLGIFDPDKTAPRLHTETDKLADRWFQGVERRLEGREWIATDEFTAADLMMACIVRDVRKTDRLTRFPRIKAYYDRCTARPAWQRTLGLYAERLGVNVDDIR